MARPLNREEKLAPVKLTFTVSELACLHLLCRVCLQAEGATEKYTMVVRVERILRDALELRGCVLTAEGWMA